MGPRCPVPGPKTVRRAVSNPQAEAVEEIITTTHPQTRRPVDGVVSASRSWAMGLAPQPAFSSWSNSWPIRPHNRLVRPRNRLVRPRNSTFGRGACSPMSPGGIGGGGRSLTQRAAVNLPCPAVRTAIRSPPDAPNHRQAKGGGRE